MSADFICSRLLELETSDVARSLPELSATCRDARYRIANLEAEAGGLRTRMAELENAVGVAQSLRRIADALEPIRQLQVRSGTVSLEVHNPYRGADDGGGQ